jgi:topoisomerase-4 subunit A
LSINNNGEAEVVKINLSPSCSARNKELDFYFEEMEIRSRSSMGNQVTKYPIRSVKMKEKGRSTLTGRDIWFDDVFGRLNLEEKGTYLGKFEAEDKIIVMTIDGNYELVNQELTQRFSVENIVLIEQYDPAKIFTAVYLDNDKQQYNVKRFKIETTTLSTKFLFIKDGKDNRLETVTSSDNPILKVSSGRGQQVRSAKFKIEKMVEVMGWKAVGTKLVEFSKSVEMEWEDANLSKGEQKELF